MVSCQSQTPALNGHAAAFTEQEPKVWSGYFEWELNEEKRKLAAEMMSKNTFPDPPGESRVMRLTDIRY